MKKLFIILGLTLTVLTGCEKEEDDKVNQAQDCLDNAVVPSDATACLNLITGIYNEQANRIRCGLVVLESGTTQSEIVDAFTQMDNGTEDPVAELATVLGVGDYDASGTVDATDEAVAENVRDVCYLSESKGLRTVAQLILFGTRAQVAADALGDPENPQDVANNINNMSDADAGEFANDVYDLYCVPTFSNQDICGSLEGAGAGSGTDVAVGAALKACIAANNCI